MGFLIFLIGLCFGSFANVCIYRLPKGKSLIYPGSFCPNCGKNIKWYDNIPLLSYILLKGKCRYCRKKISFRYFTVELLTGLFFFSIYKKFGFTAFNLVYDTFFLSLIIVSFIDIDTFLIPDVIVIPGIFLGLLFSFLFPEIHNMGRFESFIYSFTGTIMGGGALFLLAIIGKILFKKEAMGGGDIKLLGMIGSFLGWKPIFLTLFFGSLLGTLISLILILLKKRKIDDYVPFGPYLSLGAIISIFFKENYFLGFFIN
ncbi:MAG: prepilin peptidase [Candidatus Omnitrophica bacterium]|nr:prepilin peptidase [Candidatus Omnitrophota bacterium]MCM8807592.1 prepilin peptidase [Candidatus Omnitrophota bacterium]